MDIQKEREAFLNYIKKEYPLTYGDISDSIDVMHHFKKEFNAWIEAKAQAVPEGFVLVPEKATKNMLNAGYEAHDGFFSNGAVQDVYVAMIEAREPK